MNVGGKRREVLWWAGEEVSYLGTTETYLILHLRPVVHYKNAR
jgi:hypothetical protein